MRKKIAISCAIAGAILSFLATQIYFVRFCGKYLCFPSTREGINHITQSPNPYRTTTEERFVEPLRFFHLGKSEPGFTFIKNILQTLYYKPFKEDVLLFTQYQAAHVGDPQDPNKTIRPIYAIPQNEETEKMKFNEENWNKMMKFAKSISNENSLTIALDSYFKANILFIATLLIVGSVILSELSQKNK